MYKSLSIAAVAAAIIVMPATAQNCARLVGTTVQPKSVGQIATSLPRIEKKSEFETTSAFEARIRAAAAGIIKLVIVEKTIVNQDSIAPTEYDADAGHMTIRASAFEWGNMFWTMAFIAAEPGGIKPDLQYNIGTRLTSGSRQTGSYIGSNSFGATSRIDTSDEMTAAIWSRAAANKNDTMFEGGEHAVLGTIPMLPQVARTMKAQLRFALEVAPRYPFLRAGVLPKTVATFEDPRSRREAFQILIADVRCGLVMNRVGKVLAAYPAKGAD